MIVFDPALEYRQALELQRLGRHAEATAVFDCLIEALPNAFECHFHRGVSLTASGHYADARDAYRSAIRLRPDIFEAHNNLGQLLQLSSDYDNALRHHDIAVALNPRSADAHNSRGNCLAALDRRAEAMDAFEAAIALAPEHAPARNNLGILQHRACNYAEALAGYQKAIEIAEQQGSDFPEARYNRGLLRLLAGDFEAGWEDYDFRLEIDGQRRPLESHSLARVIAHGKVYVRAEQGYGDTLQFVRYLPMLKRQGVSVAFECQRGLAKLLRESRLCDEIVERDVSNSPLPAPPEAIEIFVQSLPRLFQTRLDTVPHAAPYLSVPQDNLERWSARIDALTPRAKNTLRIGIVWRGSQSDIFNRQRSCSLDDLAPLLAMKNIHFFGLQKETNLDERAAFTLLGDEFADFADTAAVIQHMDLVITVDTSTAHLAGALGKPTWTLIPWCPDWRWLADGEDSIWYPAMRLFRQAEPDRWEPVIEKIMRTLESDISVRKMGTVLSAKRPKRME